MKLRVKGNSIRLRLTKSEVNALASGAEVKEQTIISAVSAFSYTLNTWHLDVASVAWDKALVLQIPHKDAQHWASDDTAVGLEYTIDNQTPVPLSILVEKDFACLKPRSDEDPAEQFPHPNEGGMKC